jgi:hypothetical protein
MSVDVPVPGPANRSPQRMITRISVRGGQGQLVHGGWGRILRNEEVFWSGWAPDTARAQYFEYQGIVIAGAATDEVHVQIAESLTPH